MKKARRTVLAGPITHRHYGKIVREVVLKANFASALCQSTALSRIRGDFTMFMAMFGTGPRIAGTQATAVIRGMVAQERPTAVSFLAVPGSTVHSSSARPIASGTLPTTGTATWAFVSGGRLPPRIARSASRTAAIVRLPAAVTASRYHARILTNDRNHSRRISARCRHREALRPFEAPSRAGHRCRVTSRGILFTHGWRFRTSFLQAAQAWSRCNDTV